jgi:hypothetical protein
VQDSGWGQETRRRKRCYSKQKASSTVVPKGYYQDTKCILQKMGHRELAEKKEEEERDNWFNHLRPMTKPKQTWQEKRLTKEEGVSSGEEASKVTPATGEHNLRSRDGNSESGNCNPESGNYHPESGNHNPDSRNSNTGKENNRQGEEPVLMDINIIFMIPAKFCAPTEDVKELALGAECVEKPLFIQGHLD